jgi:hypothetical protein
MEIPGNRQFHRIRSDGKTWKHDRQRYRSYDLGTTRTRCRLGYSRSMHQFVAAASGLEDYPPLVRVVPFYLLPSARLTLVV